MPQTLTDFLVTARSFDEYAAMFALEPEALAGLDVLDCPGGAASFTADASALGARVTAVDPAYAMAPGDLAVRALDDVRTGADHIARHADAYDWTTFGTPEQHSSARTAAAGRFAWDLRRNPDRYLAASLPDLPLPDGCMDLVLSSHLLFTYADRLDAAFHLAAVAELLRVLRPGGELRVFSLVDISGRRPAALQAVCDASAAQGHEVQEVPVAYRVQRGADTMLLLRRSG